jgi:hypothetical protein
MECRATPEAEQAERGIERVDFELPNASEVRRGAFAFVLHNVFSVDECEQMIADSEARGYEQALVNTGRSQVLDTSYRNSSRNIYDCESLADEIYSRIRAHIPSEGCFGYHTYGEPKRWACEGLNDRLRFLRYDPGDFFAPHTDGYYQRPYNHPRPACSKLTVMLYLNSGGGGGGSFEGGETRFVAEGRDAGPSVALTPTAGDVLVFTHPVLHEGSMVIRGRKYAVRTDVMYSELGVAAPRTVGYGGAGVAPGEASTGGQQQAVHSAVDLERSPSIEAAQTEANAHEATAGGAAELVPLPESMWRV